MLTEQKKTNVRITKVGDKYAVVGMHNQPVCYVTPAEATRLNLMDSLTAPEK
jgi:hypothetical protein